MTQQLKELEEDGLIIRTEYKEKPPRVEYNLSARGKTLIPVLKALSDWGIEIDDPVSMKTWNPVIAEVKIPAANNSILKTESDL